MTVVIKISGIYDEEGITVARRQMKQIGIEIDENFAPVPMDGDKGEYVFRGEMHERSFLKGAYPPAWSVYADGQIAPMGEARWDTLSFKEE